MQFSSWYFLVNLREFLLLTCPTEIFTIFPWNDSIYQRTNSVLKGKEIQCSSSTAVYDSVDIVDVKTVETRTENK